MDGRSLAPLWADTPPDTWRASFLISNKCPAFPEGVAGSECFNAVRTARYLYIARPALAEYELYDMLADPYQLDNLYAAAGSAVIEPLAERLAALLQCSGATCRQREDAPLDVPAISPRVADSTGPAD